MPDTVSTPVSLDEKSIASLVDRFYGRAKTPGSGRFSTQPSATAGPSTWPRSPISGTSVLLASDRYKGSPMMAHLEIPQMDQQHFNRWIELWREPTAEVFGPEISQALVAKASTMGERFLEVSTRVRESL
jgi:hemoglobin